MQDFPPSPERLVTQPDANCSRFPTPRRTVCHLRAFLPIEQVGRRLGAPIPLACDPDETGIDVPTFRPIGSATVRQLMDMTTGLTWSEDCCAPNADIPGSGPRPQVRSPNRPKTTAWARPSPTAG